LGSLKTELDASYSAPLPSGSGDTPAAPAPLARSLENAIAKVIGAPSSLVVALAASDEELRAGFEQAIETTRRRALHVPVEAGPGLEDRALGALASALRRRVSGRPGVAALLDPLIQNAASFVLGEDLPGLAPFLTAEALDEVPAVAARVLVSRFQPALAAQLDVPVAILGALVAERTGSEGALEAVSPHELLRVLGRMAARAGGAIVFSCATGSEHAAATAVAALAAIERTPESVLWALGCRREAWEAQRALLVPDERKRIEGAVRFCVPAAVVPTPAGPPPPAVTVRPAALRLDRGVTLVLSLRRLRPFVPRRDDADETPRRDLGLRVKRALADRVRKAVLARLVARKKAKTAVVRAPSAPRVEAPRRVAPPERAPSALKRAIVVSIPFFFLASLGIFAHRELDFRASPRQPTPDWVLRLNKIRPIPVQPLPAQPRPTSAPRQAPVPQPQPPVANNQPPPPPRQRYYPQKNRSGARFAMDENATPVQQKLSSFDQTQAGAQQSELFCKLYDEGAGNDADTGLLRRGLLLRAAPYRNEAPVLQRILGALAPENPQDLRSTALTALTMGNFGLPPEGRARLEAIAAQETDDALRNQAKTALAQMPRGK
jgi:hypothetical protein